MGWMIAIAVVTVAPPDADEVATRRARVSEIHQLAEPRSPHDVKVFLAAVRDAKAAWERVVALQAMQPWHRDAGTRQVAGLLKDPDATVRLEAAIVYYRWTQDPATLPRLKAAVAKGASVRRAFQLEQKQGRAVYHHTARPFFQALLRHPLVYARLDGALGLIEIGGDARKAGLSALETTLASNEPDDRLLAIKYMRVQWDEPAFGPLLQRAAEDSDVRVRTAAQQLLSAPR